MADSTLWTRQPGFSIYTTYTIIKALIKLPCLMLLYTVPHFRPLRAWTYQQAFARALTRLLFQYASVVEFSPAQSLDPGKEKDRFVVIEPFTNPDENDPQSKSIYTGIAKPSSTPNGISPATIGGTCLTPTRRRIFLHFHGGAYVLFDCRDRDMAFGASLLLQASASADSGADAITAYAHLVLRLKVDARDVILSGDSAGGNLALALLRYLEEETKVLPLPGGVVLWSPWTDLSVDPEELRARAEDRLDIVPVRVVEWGLRVFLPEGITLDQDCEGGKGVCENAYISPVTRGIETEVPVWVQVGGKEIIREDILRWVEVQRRAGGRLRVYEIANAPHDMFMAGEGLGFVRESREAAEDAIRFLDGRE
ncbi:putative alpha beta hydrolase fold-3 domain-containing protein [Parachaetomium inaequale]|uniref:Alpha beta hydrolase fold-3 domain-containing protein n=1 Tax=Parachaetomium inaequale TaxID=2588326 RepID=A0AAN6PIM5_9PEZI|nr:putative alpha beta hydrolase fold-3 domain-containing protein [Parachaetomium inaequale]